MRQLAVVVMVLCSLEIAAQEIGRGISDPVEFSRIKTFSAFRSSSNNLYVDSNDDSKHPLPGETIVLADLQGPGIVTHMWITVADNEYGWPRLLRLRVYYDGHKTPSVDVPLGDFFGVGHGYERNVNSQMVRNASFGRARNVYWPMPFHKSARITITNEGKRRVTSIYYHVDWQKHDRLPQDIGYFHAYYRQAAPPAKGTLYTLLNINGEGQYVGSVLNIIQTQMGWFGEGDEMFYVDGEHAPRIEGTGTEDYFNDAWALRVSDGEWTGVPVAEGEGFGARLTGYRWHVPDPVPFKKSLMVGIEHFGWTYNTDGTARSGFEERSDFFSSVAFWYQRGVNEDLAEPPHGSARLPLGNAAQIEVEQDLSKISAEAGSVSVQKEVFWSKDLLFLNAHGPRSKLNVGFDVEKDGFYEVIAQIAQGPDYGDYVATLDGKQTNSTLVTWGPLDALAPAVETIHNYQPEIFVGIDHRLGWFKLTKGRHVLSFNCVGNDKLSSGFNLGIDSIVLSEIRDGESLVQSTGVGLSSFDVSEAGLPFRPLSGQSVYRGTTLSSYISQLKRASSGSRADIIRAIGAFGSDASSASGVLLPFLSDPDPEVRGAAVSVLGQLNASAMAPAIAMLLKDKDVHVRESGALALRNIGKDAKTAAPELAAALSDPATTVGMASALALGKMGAEPQLGVNALVSRLHDLDQKQMTNDEVQLARNIVYALGQMGPGARSAVSALRQVQHLRVRYLALEAIGQIEGNPTPTWH